MEASLLNYCLFQNLLFVESVETIVYPERILTSQQFFFEF